MRDTVKLTHDLTHDGTNPHCRYCGAEGAALAIKRIQAINKRA